MKGLFSLSILLLIHLEIFSQIDETNKWKYNIATGLNFRIPDKNSKNEYKSSAFPIAGIEVLYRTKHNYLLRGSFIHEWQRVVSISPYYKITNSSVDCEIQPGYNFSDFISVYSGIYSRTSNSATLTYLTKDGKKSKIANNFPNEVGLSSGIELHLRPGFSVETDFYFYRANIRESLVQIRLNFKLGKNVKKVNKKQEVFSELTNLKNGILLVKLNSYQNKINAYLNSGNTEKADYFTKIQNSENKMFVKLFNQFYDFSNVAYFKSEHTDSILQGKYNNVLFGADWKPISVLTIDDSNKVFIAAFGDIPLDTVIRYSGYEYDFSDDINGKREVFYGGTEINTEALVIYDRKMQAKKKPFPYFSGHFPNMIKTNFRRALFIEEVETDYKQYILKINVKLYKKYNSYSNYFSNTND